MATTTSSVPVHRPEHDAKIGVLGAMLKDFVLSKMPEVINNTTVSTSPHGLQDFQSFRFFEEIHHKGSLTPRRFLGEWDANGVLLSWVGEVPNLSSTNEFVEQFQDLRDVHSQHGKIVAEFLPFIFGGVNPLDPRVVSICRHVGSDYYHGNYLGTKLVQLLISEWEKINSELEEIFQSAKQQASDAVLQKQIKKNIDEKRVYQLIQSEAKTALFRCKERLNRWQSSAAVCEIAKELAFDLEEILQTYKGDHGWASIRLIRNPDPAVKRVLTLLALLLPASLQMLLIEADIERHRRPRGPKLKAQNMSPTEGEGEAEKALFSGLSPDLALEIPFQKYLRDWNVFQLFTASKADDVEELESFMLLHGTTGALRSDHKGLGREMSPGSR